MPVVTSAAMRLPAMQGACHSADEVRAMTPAPGRRCAAALLMSAAAAFADLPIEHTGVAELKPDNGHRLVHCRQDSARARRRQPHPRHRWG